MGANELLILNYPSLDRRLTSLYSHLNASGAQQELFLRDPVGTLNTFIFPELVLPDVSIGAANRLLMAALTNERFMAWVSEKQSEFDAQVEQLTSEISTYPRAEDDAELDDLSRRLEAAKIVAMRTDRQALYTELADGLLQAMDRELMFSFSVLGTTPGPEPGGGGIPEHCKDFHPGKKPIQPPGSCEPPIIITGPVPPADTFVASETVFLAIAVAMFFVLVTQIDFTPKPVPIVGLDRLDVEKVSASLAAQLSDQAERARGSGALTSVSAFGERYLTR
jgi:hypothetical protein